MPMPSLRPADSRRLTKPATTRSGAKKSSRSKWLPTFTPLRTRRSSSFHCAGPSPSMVNVPALPSSLPIVPTGQPLKDFSPPATPLNNRPPLAMRRSNAATRRDDVPPVFHIDLRPVEVLPGGLRTPQGGAFQFSKTSGAKITPKRPESLLERLDACDGAPSRRDNDERSVSERAQSLLDMNDSEILEELEHEGPTSGMQKLMDEFKAACAELEMGAAIEATGEGKGVETSPSYPFPRMPVSAVGSRNASSSTGRTLVPEPPSTRGPPPTSRVLQEAPSAFPLPPVVVAAPAHVSAIPPSLSRQPSGTPLQPLSPPPPKRQLERGSSLPELRAAVEVAQTRVATELRRQKEERDSAEVEEVEVGRWDRLTELERRTSQVIEHGRRSSSLPSMAPPLVSKGFFFRRPSKALNPSTASTSSNMLSHPIVPASRVAPDFKSFAFRASAALRRHSTPKHAASLVASVDGRRDGVPKGLGIVAESETIGEEREDEGGKMEMKRSAVPLRPPLLPSSSASSGKSFDELLDHYAADSPVPVLVPSPSVASAVENCQTTKSVDADVTIAVQPATPGPRPPSQAIAPPLRTHFSEPPAVASAAQIPFDLPARFPSPPPTRAASRLSRAKIDKPPQVRQAHTSPPARKGRSRERQTSAQRLGASSSSRRRSEDLVAELFGKGRAVKPLVFKGQEGGRTSDVEEKSELFARGYSNPLGIALDGSPPTGTKSPPRVDRVFVSALPLAPSFSSGPAATAPPPLMPLHAPLVGEGQPSRRLSFELPPKPRRAPLDDEATCRKEVAWEEVAGVKRYKGMERPCVEGVVRLPCGRV